MLPSPATLQRPSNPALPTFPKTIPTTPEPLPTLRDLLATRFPSVLPCPGVSREHLRDTPALSR